jgi:hypothetical protein
VFLVVFEGIQSMRLRSIFTNNTENTYQSISTFVEKVRLASRRDAVFIMVINHTSKFVADSRSVFAFVGDPETKIPFDDVSIRSTYRQTLIEKRAICTNRLADSPALHHGLVIAVAVAVAVVAVPSLARRSR